jgi:hypothetical protein
VQGKDLIPRSWSDQGIVTGLAAGLEYLLTVTTQSGCARSRARPGRTSTQRWWQCSRLARVDRALAQREETRQRLFAPAQ